MRLKLAVVAMAVVLLAGCATLNIGKSWSEWTPKQKATYFMKIYNAQYNDAMTMAKLPAITEDQKAMVKLKKEVLTKLRPILVIYVGTVDVGGVADAEIETQILNLINELSAIGG